MKVLLTIWISAVLIQEVVPGTLVRYPRHASNTPSYLHTEYEAKIEQKGKHGNESFGSVSGKQAIEHDNCNDDWNAFANKCAALIKDLVASLANAVSSKPGDATNLQLHIKNTFRHLDNTHNCSCLNHTGKRLSDLDLSHLFDNLTLSTIKPVEGHDGDDEPGTYNHPKKLHDGGNVNPEDEDDPNSTSNSRRQTKHESHHSPDPNIASVSHVPQDAEGQEGVFHPFLTTPLPSDHSDSHDVIATVPPYYHANSNSPLESSSSQKSTPHDHSDFTHDSAPVDVEPALIVKDHTKGDNDSPVVIIPLTTSIPTKHQDTETTNPTHDITSHDGNSHGTDSQDDNFPITSDGHSYESPDHDSKSPDDKSTAIPVINTSSNIPESPEPTYTSPTPSPLENSQTEDSGKGCTSDCEQKTTACDETTGADETVTVPSIVPGSSSNDDGHEVLITPKPILAVDDEAPKTGDSVGDESHAGHSNNDDSNTGHPNHDDITTEHPDHDDISPVQPVDDSNTGHSDGDSKMGHPKHEDINPGHSNDDSNMGHPNHDDIHTGHSNNDDTNTGHSDDGDSNKDDEGCSTTPQPVYPIDKEEHIGIAHPHTAEESHYTTEKDADDVILPIHTPVTDDHERGTYTTIMPVSLAPAAEEKDHTEVSEIPVLVPTTFQTTSEDPTHSPESTHQPKFVSITTASTPLESDEGEQHDKHHDGDDDEDDCCSCESCTEEEEQDPHKARQNLCRSLEEARKELKAIFDKITKKLRCCKKVPQTITTSSSTH